MKVTSLCPVLTARTVLAGLMLIIGLGRLGLYTSRSNTIAPEWLYGVGLTAGGVALLLSGACKANRLSSRVYAALSAAVLLGLAVDVSIKAGSPLNTSALNLYWLAIVSIIEVTVRHECE
jgi:hypothetical protein